MVATAVGPVVVEIEGITEPARFSRLSDALDALWDALRVLPLGWTQFDACRKSVGPGTIDRVTESVNRDGKLILSFTMADRAHEVRIHLAETKSGSHQ